MRRIARRSLPFGLTAAVALPLLLPADVFGRSSRRRGGAARPRGARRRAGGPPGRSRRCTATGGTTVLSAGPSDVERRGAPRATDHMRIASVAKAFSGAVALHLVQAGGSASTTRSAQRLPGMPDAWAAVTVRQLLNHTSGVPDYTQSTLRRAGRRRTRAASSRPRRSSTGCAATTSSSRRARRLRVLEHRQHRRRPDRRAGDRPALRRPLLAAIVFGPAKLRQTSFPTRRVSLPGRSSTATSSAPGQAGGRHDVPEPERRLGLGRRSSRPRATSTASSAATSARGSSARRSSASRCSSSAGRRARRDRDERRRARPLPLQDPLRHGLRPHRQLPRLRAVGRRDRGREPLGDDHVTSPPQGALLRQLRACRRRRSARCCRVARGRAGGQQVFTTASGFSKKRSA